MTLKWFLYPMAVALILGVACGGDGEEAEAPSQLTGIITDIDGETIAEIQGFTLKADDETYEIRIADDIEYDFPLSHLHEHLVGAEPVEVDLEERDDELYALSIEDA